MLAAVAPADGQDCNRSDMTVCTGRRRQRHDAQVYDAQIHVAQVYDAQIHDAQIYDAQTYDHTKGCCRALQQVLVCGSLCEGLS